MIARLCALMIIAFALPRDGHATVLATPPEESTVLLMPPQASEKDSATKAASTLAKKAKAKRSVNVSGYMQAFYKARRDVNGDSATEPSVFRMQRVRIQFKGDVNKHVSYEVEVDPRAPEINGILRDAFVSLDYIPRHELRIGQQKTLFGWENPVSSSRLFTVNRTEVSEGLARGINLRDIGIGLVGSFRVNDRFRFEDALNIVNGSGLNVQADSTAKKNVWGRVGARYRHGDLTVRFGISAGSGDQIEPPSAPDLNNGFKFDFTRTGADVQIDHPRFLAIAEYAQGDDKAPASLPEVGGSVNGYYVLLVPKTRWNVGPIVRYDTLDEFRRVTLGAYAGLPSDDVSLLFNYEKLEDDLGKHDDKFYLRLQVRF